MYYVEQHDEKDCGAACLAMICGHYGYKASLQEFRKKVHFNGNYSSVYDIVEAGKQLDLDVDALEGTYDEFVSCLKASEITLPCVAHTTSEEGVKHFVVISRASKKKVQVVDPSIGKIIYSTEDFINIWSGVIINFRKTAFFSKRKCENSLKKLSIYCLENNIKNILIVSVLSFLIAVVGIAGSSTFQIIMVSVSSIDHTAEQMDRNSYSGDQFEKCINKIMTYINKATNKYFNSVDIVCMSIATLFILSGILQLLRGKLLAFLSKRVEESLMVKYCTHSVRLPVAFFQNNHTGALLSRFEDINSIRDAFANSTVTLMLDTMMILFGGIVLYTISPLLLLETAMVVVTFIIVVRSFFHKIKAVNKYIMEREARMISSLKESYDGVHTVKALNAEEEINERNQFYIKNFVDGVFKGEVLNVCQQVTINIVSSLGMIGVLWVGAYNVLKGQLSFGSLITFGTLIGYFLQPLKNLMALQPILQTAIVSSERLDDIFLEELEKTGTNEETPHEYADIVFDKVNFSYGEKEVLRDVSISFRRDRKIAIVGESGSGKTTVAKLMLNFYSIQSGTIKIDSINIDDICRDTLRSNIAYVPQEDYFFYDTIRNNLLYGNKRSISQDEIDQVCNICLLDELIGTSADKYDTLIEENGCNLSAGQKQRIALARALLRNAKIIILDEALSNLDKNMMVNILGKLCKCESYKTTGFIFITHDSYIADHCDDKYLLREGVIVKELC